MLDQNADMDDRIRIAAGRSPALIKIYVRLGPNNGETERTIAFRIPPTLSAEALLERGAAIDGNQATISVAWEPEDDRYGRGIPVYSCPDLDDPGSGEFVATSVTRVLGDCQRSLVKYLKSQGYEVQFA